MFRKIGSKNCSWMMIKSFLIIRFSKKRLSTISRQQQRSIAHLSHFSSSRLFSAKLHNACGHDIKRHVTRIYEDLREWRRRHTGNKITNYLRPYLCSVEHRHKNLCFFRYRFLWWFIFMCVFAEKWFFMAKFLFNFMLSIFPSRAQHSKPDTFMFDARFSN